MPDESADRIPALSPKRKVAVALALTLAAGYVDAVSYLMLFHVFTANMTGNTAATGLYLVQGNWHMAFHRFWPIPMFLLGLIVAGFGLELGQRHKVRRLLSACLIVEIVLLALLIGLGSLLMRDVPANSPPPTQVAVILVFLSATAMGIQNASLRHAGALSIHTTHVTGTITTFAQKLVGLCFWFYDSAGEDGFSTALRRAWSHKRFRQVVFLGGLWLVFFAGGAAGAAAAIAWGMYSFDVPLAVVIAAFAVDLAWPLPIQPRE